MQGSISIIVPARNEEKRLPALLDTLKREIADAPEGIEIEVIVVDDESEDRTAEIAKAGGTRVLRSDQTEQGRAGKARACWAGAQKARGEFLMFLDADTFFVPGGLQRICGTYTEGLLSVQPYHAVQRFYETLSVFFNIIVMAGVNAFTPFSRKGEPFGCFGPCLFCSRKDYFEVGGHGRILDELVDDIALARLFKQNGRKVFCFGGRSSIEFRMYPEGLSDLTEGWTKNMATGAQFSAPIINVLLFIWIAGVANLALSFWQAFSLNQALFIGLSSFVYVLYSYQVGRHMKQIGNFPVITAFLFPVYMCFFIGVFFYSIFKTKIAKNVTWRGRKIRV
jgi:4,4'-diaponeurosporenoate glycosyltransferase